MEEPCCRERSFQSPSQDLQDSLSCFPPKNAAIRLFPMDTTTTASLENQIETRPMTSCDISQPDSEVGGLD